MEKLPASDDHLYGLILVTWSAQHQLGVEVWGPKKQKNSSKVKNWRDLISVGTNHEKTVLYSKPFINALILQNIKILINASSIRSDISNKMKSP